MFDRVVAALAEMADEARAAGGDVFWAAVAYGDPPQFSSKVSLGAASADRRDASMMRLVHQFNVDAGPCLSPDALAPEPGATVWYVYSARWPVGGVFRRRVYAHLPPDSESGGKHKPGRDHAALDLVREVLVNWSNAVHASQLVWREPTAAA